MRAGRRVDPGQIYVTVHRYVTDFDHFWYGDSPWRDIKESQIFLLYDPYFGFYGVLKFLNIAASSYLQNVITQQPMLIGTWFRCLSLGFRLGIMV